MTQPVYRQDADEGLLIRGPRLRSGAGHTEHMVGAERRGWLPRWSVRARILAAILLVTVVGLGVTGSVSHLIQRERVLSGVDDDLDRQVAAARQLLESRAGEFSSARASLEALLATLPAPADGSVLGIVDGEPALVPGTPMAFTLEDSPLVDRVVAEVADGSARQGSAVIEGAEFRYVAVPILVEGADDDGVYLVAIDVRAALEPTDRSLVVFAIVAAVTLVAVGLAGWLVAGQLLRPLRRLRETTERITATDLGERIPVDGRDDISRLTETVNEMLDRLDAALRNQRELLDDVRHELRTPLTIVRGHLELVDATDPEDVRRTAELAVDELERMGALVDALAALAEVRSTVPVLRPIDLGRLTRDLAELVSAIPGHPWTLAESAEGELVADRSLLVQAVLQLADNAAKHAPSGTPIEIGSRRVDGAVELWVRDHGPGIPAGQETQIFERFARVPGTPRRGSGLGLSIVDGIARAHGGSVRVESPGDGARFVIAVPEGGTS